MIRGWHARSLALSFSLLLFAAGCGVEVTSTTGEGLADLEVIWSIDGSDSTAYCTDLAIGGWLIKARGPDSVDVFVDCFDEWTTFSELYGLLEGFYTITVSALDPADFVITSLSSSIDLFYAGDVDVLDFTFTETDFF
jgi:hypothetical protein